MQRGEGLEREEQAQKTAHTEMAEQLICARHEIVIRVARNSGGGGDTREESREAGGEAWEDIVAEPVAVEALIGIRVIMADGQIVLGSIVMQDGLREVQKGADDGEGAEVGDRADAAEAAEAGAAEEAEEDGFRLVIGVMSEEDRGSLLLARDVAEAAEAAAAGGVFERKMVLAGIGGDINAG